MASTSEEGAKKLQSGCAFYEQLDEVLGARDAINPERMTVSKSSIIPDKTGRDSSPQSSIRPKKRNESPATRAADSQPSTSPATESESSPKTEEIGGKKEATKGKTAKRKGKLPSDSDDDHYMTRICDMWRLSMENQNARFEKSMQLQQAAIESQTEQTKAIVSGLKDILKECLKSD